MHTVNIRALLRAPAVRSAAVLYGSVAFLCTRVPLLDYLGYEFSALFAFIAACASGLLTIRPVKESLGEPGETPLPRRAARAAGACAAVSLLLLAIPLVIISGNALFVRNCSMVEGLAFFTLLAPVSALFGVSLGFFCAVTFVHPRRLFVLSCFLLLLYSAGLGYFTPAVYSYNFLYGYFPGLTYDEVIPLSRTLVLFRLLTLFVSAVLLWMGMITVTDLIPAAAPGRGRLRTLVAGLVSGERRIRSAAIACALAGFYLFRCDLGFESTASYIRRTLGAEMRTEHFILYYSPASFTADEIQQAAREHEFRLGQVLDAFSLPRGVFFESYIYPSAEVKQRLIGAGNTDIAKPWSGQIHISRQSLEGSLKHELVHAAAAPFGIPVIRASLSTGLVEGLAMAVDGEWGNRTVHEYAAAIREAGIAPPIEGIMSFWGFASHQSSVSYVLAGSFCRYLIDRYGMRNLTLVYRSLDFMGVYGRSLPELAVEWEGYLDRVPLDDVDQDGVDALFRRVPIFRKVCARVLARRALLARGSFARKEYAVAESLYAGVYADGGGYDAFAGYLTSALREGEMGVLTSALDTVILPDEHPARYLPLFISIGDAYWASGEQEKAYAMYDRVYQADFTEGYTEAAALRLLAMDADPGGKRFLLLFLTDYTDSLRIAAVDSLLRGGPGDPGERVLAYMKARSMLREGDFAGAVVTLKDLDLTSADVALEALRLRYLGQALYRLGRYAEARRAFWISLNAEDSDIGEIKVNTWLDRCEWAEEHGF
jgi:tetratricopeptide (TPR) repeat protein